MTHNTPIALLFPGLSWSCPKWRDGWCSKQAPRGIPYVYIMPILPFCIFIYMARMGNLWLPKSKSYGNQKYWKILQITCHQHSKRGERNKAARRVSPCNITSIVTWNRYQPTTWMTRSFGISTFSEISQTTGYTDGRSVADSDKIPKQMMRRSNILFNAWAYEVVIWALSEHRDHIVNQQRGRHWPFQFHALGFHHDEYQWRYLLVFQTYGTPRCRPLVWSKTE